MASEANGRLYQDASRYYLPKDAPEHERLDRQSESLIAIMKNQPFHAPLVNPTRILDIGCGTGHMSNLLASLYPSAQVIGIDLAPVPESRHGKLGNLEYVQGDVRELIGKDPRFQLESFDYIFQRLLVCGLTQWPEYVSSVARLLRPGGWMESQEPSMHLRSAKDEPLAESMQWYRDFRQDATAAGLDIEVGAKLRQIFQSTSILDNVQEQTYRCAPTASEERPEYYAMEAQFEGLYSLIASKVCGAVRGEEAAAEIVKSIRSAWKEFEEGSFVCLYIVTGQRKE